MIARKFQAAALAVCATLGLSACYDGYGYGGIASAGYVYDDGYYGDYYGSPYYGGGLGYGWYDGFYYPGSGYYVFDRGGRRHAWNDRQRDYWQSRHGDGSGGPRRPAWEGNRGNVTPEQRQAWQARQNDPQFQARRDAWRAQRQQQGVAADPARQAQREAWRAQRQSQPSATPQAAPQMRSFGGGGGGRPAWRGGGRRGN